MLNSTSVSSLGRERWQSGGTRAISDRQSIGWDCVQMQAGLCEVDKHIRELVLVEKRKSREVDCKGNRRQCKGPEEEECCYYTMLFLTEYPQQ